MNLEKCITNIESASVSYEWKIKNFILNNKKNGEALVSPRFTMPNNDNLKWFIKLFPNGNKEEFKDYVSVFLYLITDNPNHKVQYEFSIINKNGKKVNKSSNLTIFENTTTGLGYSRFILSESLLNSKGTMLPDDTLTICCDVSVGLNNEICVTKTNGPKRFKFDKKSKEQKQICKDLDNLFKKEVFADILLTTCTKQLKAHKYILAARSPVFFAMFSNNMLEKQQSEIKIVDFDCEVVSDMLEFIYTGNVKNIEKNAMSLLSIADKYEIKGLKNLCEDFLNNSMSIENAIDLLILADRHNFKDFKTKVIKFIVNYRKLITKTPQFEDLKIKHPNLIADLFCSEC